MKEFKNIEELANNLGDGGQFNQDKEYSTIGEVIDDLMNLANTDKVYAFYDEHQGFSPSDKFRNSSLEDATKEDFESEMEELLEHANNIISIADKPLTEEDIDYIKEDMESRGQDSDDFKY